MDPSTYNQMLSQMLYGGSLPYGASLGNATSWQGAATGAPGAGVSTGMAGDAPTGAGAGAGMLGMPPPGGGMPMHPSAPQAGGPMGYGQTPPAQGSVGALRQTMLPYTQNAYPAGQNPFKLQQPMSQYAGPSMAPPMGLNGGGGGGR